MFSSSAAANVVTSEASAAIRGVGESDFTVTRVAWTSLQQGLVVVQCVMVHRGGSALAGRSVTLLRISAPIDRQGSC